MPIGKEQWQVVREPLDWQTGQDSWRRKLLKNNTCRYFFSVKKEQEERDECLEGKSENAFSLLILFLYFFFSVSVLTNRTLISPGISKL